MHFGGLSQKDINDLILIFSHALAGKLPIVSSVFVDLEDAHCRYTHLKPFNISIRFHRM